MSLFKAKEWWSSGGFLSEETACLLNCSLTTAQLGPEGSGDMIIYATPDGLIQLFKPQGSYQPTDLILEYMTEQPILQIECGKLMPGSSLEHIAILHNLNISVYMLSTKEGHTEYGDQNILVQQYCHKLPRAAYCFIIGPFGGAKFRDFICVQSLDGMLSFYEQDIASFSCFLPAVLIPGPLAYSHCADFFISISPNWMIEAYSYYNLSQMSDIGNGKRILGKKLVPDWVYNVGENILTMQTIQVSNNSCCFIMMGEKCVYCLFDNGMLKFIKRFDFEPVCLHAYLIGWYYENNARLMMMIVSDTSTLLIYEQTTLMWSCQLTFMPISIRRAFFPLLPGALVMVTDYGEVKCCYLGTEPELFTAPPLPNLDIDLEEAQRELDRLQSVIDNLHDMNEHNQINQLCEKEVPFEIRVNSELEINDNLSVPNIDDKKCELFKCKVEVSIKPLDKRNIESMQVTFSVCSPLACSNQNKILSEIKDENLVETYIYLSALVSVPSLSLHVYLLYLTSDGNVRVLHKQDMLPFKLVFYPARPVKEFKYKLTLLVDGLTCSLIELFKEFSAESFTELDSSDGVVAFSNPCDDSLVTIVSAKSSDRYRLQCNNLSMMTIVLEYFLRCINIMNRKKEKVKKDNENFIKVSISGDVSSDIFKHILKIIEKHAFLRQELQQTEDALNILSTQFILIQKKLMMKFRERSPTSCDGIAFLLKDTYSKIIRVSSQIQEYRESMFRCDCELSSLMELVIILSNLTGIDEDVLDQIKNALCFQNIQENNHNWEENVGRNIIYILHTFFVKNEKDRNKLIPFNLDASFIDFDVKRLMKYFHMFFESIFKKHNSSQNNEENNDEIQNKENDLKKPEERMENKETDENLFKIPEGSLFGQRKPLLAARLEKQSKME